MKARLQYNLYKLIGMALHKHSKNNREGKLNIYVTFGHILNAIESTFNNLGTNFRCILRSLGTRGDTLGAIGHHLEKPDKTKAIYISFPPSKAHNGFNLESIWVLCFTKVVYFL